MNKLKNINKNALIIAVSAIVLVSAISFYLGIFYQKRQSANKPSVTNSGQNVAIDGQKPPFGDMNQRTNGRQRMSLGKSASGEIISNDGTILTVKLRDGGSRIVFVSGSTKFDKSISASMGDVSIGKTVVISGETNPDGSMTADVIQIRKDEIPQK